MSQKQINAAYKRASKMSYRWFTPEQKRLIKKMERIALNDKDCRIIERAMLKRHGDNWRNNRNAKKEGNYDLFFELLLENIKLNESISRLEDKYGLDRTEVMKQFYALNRARYGGSF
jgi:hypothetical protein